MINNDRMAALFLQCGITLSDTQLVSFDRYAQLLCEWNKKINLTAITDAEGIEQKHFLDSALPLNMVGIPSGASMIDIGTGAGFPSCPMKILRRDLRITLLDSLNKRIGFLKALSDELSLSADCIHGRAEELGRTSEHRERFDVATARAVAELSQLCEYCMPFVKVGGAFIALKGSGGGEELKNAQNAIKILGGEAEGCTEYSLPGGDGRTLVVIRKVAATPEKYPRNKGQMTKKPL